MTDILATLDAKLESESEVLEALIHALQRNVFQPEVWEKLHEAAERDIRMAELSVAYESALNDKRLKLLPSPAAAELLYNAGNFYAAFGDAARSTSYLQRALQTYPAHSGAFDALERRLTAARESTKLAELYVEASSHRPRGEGAQLLRRAAELLERVPNTEEKRLDVLQQALRLDPGDEGARLGLAALLARSGRTRDELRVLEQGINVTDPPPSREAATRMRDRLVELFESLGEIEKATPHVEALLALDPSNLRGRRVGQALLEFRGVAARAASALAGAYESSGSPQEVARFLGIELEHTRGVKRAQVLRKLGLLKMDKLGDPGGAYEAVEQALTLDPADDDMRVRFVELAGALGRQLDAAKTLGKIATTAKDPPVRTRLSADMAELYASGGDKKRARAVFASVLAMPGAAEDTVLKASHALAKLYEEEGETRLFADALEKVCSLEPEEDRWRAANEKLAELAMGPLQDPARAIAAWRRLVGSASRARALEALEQLYASTNDVVELAFVMEERAKDAPPHEARTLAFRAAETLTTRPEAVGKALEAWRRFFERFGAARDAIALAAPLLEAKAEWAELAQVLEADANLAPESERGAILARAGALRLQRLRDLPAAIELFRRALATDALEKTSRAALEKLLAAGDHRAAAASALEPIYRAEESIAGLLRVLEVKATFAGSPPERLAAYDEATRAAETSPPHRGQALDFAGRGLAEAVAHEQPIESWVERVLALSEGGDPKRRASLLLKALGERPVEGPSTLVLARHTGDALAESGDVQGALSIFRRALDYDATSTEIVSRVDALLRDQGSADDRVRLYRSALDHERFPAARRRLLHQIAALERHELTDPRAAIEAYRQAVKEDHTDRDAYAALAELYGEAESWEELVDLLEEQVSHLGLSAETRDENHRLRAQLAETAASHGQAERAVRHARALLDERPSPYDSEDRVDAIDAETLDTIERVADLVGDGVLAAAALERRARVAGDPRDAVMALEKLGHVLQARSRDDAGALDAWRRAGTLAQDSGEPDSARRIFERIRKLLPSDVEITARLVTILEAQEKWAGLPDLYAVLVEAAAPGPARAAQLLKLATILGERLGDPSGAADAAARAFAYAPDSSDALAAFERLATMAGANERFARAIDDVLAGATLDPDADTAQQEPAVDRGGLLFPEKLAELAVAKARVLAMDPRRQGEAAAIYKGLLEDERLDVGARTQAVSGFEKLLELGGEGAEARRDDRRWLLRWRASHAVHEEKIVQLLAWARAEEALLGDAEGALDVHRQVLAIDPDNVEAGAAVARLTLATGDVEGAIQALFARRDRSDGAARRAVDLEIATILIERSEQLEEATRTVRELLEEAADDAEAIALAGRLLRAKSPFAEEASAMLEAACARVTKPAVRAMALSALLDAPPDVSGPEARRKWFGRLIDVQLEEGKQDAAMMSVLRAAEEFPTEHALWDRAENLARELQNPGSVADLYYRVLGRALSADDAMEIGQRAALFHEEWFDDPARVIAILKRILEIDAAASWAFDRLKLLFDAREQWDDLFLLYDRAIVAASAERRIELLEDAAQTAKDFANHSERAIGYLEQLLPLKKNPRIAASLERLYERHGRHRELITLLVSQLPQLNAKDALATRIRVATMQLVDLADPSLALTVIEEILTPDPKEAPSLAAIGAPTDKTRVQVVELLEKILTTAPRDAEMRESMLPPPASTASLAPPSAPPTTPTLQSNAESTESATSRNTPSPPSIPPPRGRVKKVPVRQRAAALLREHYLQTEQDAALAHVLEVELEVIKSVKERIRRHKKIADLYTKLGSTSEALEHYIALVMLEPDEESHRESLARLAEQVGRFDRMADVLANAADDCTDDSLRVDLLMQAAIVHEEKLGDAARAIDLYLRVLSIASAGKPVLLSAARRVDPLLLGAGRAAERLHVLERRSDLETDEDAKRATLGDAAQLAASLGEDDRAIAAWETRLRGDESDVEALDGLVSLLEHGARWQPLVEALERRAAISTDEARRRRDCVSAARIHAKELGEPTRAIDAWRAIEQDFGADDESTGALALLLREQARWDELASLLESAAARDTHTAEQRALLLRQLGDVRREHTGDPKGAIGAYEAALTAYPGEPGALEGLRALLENEDHRGTAVRALHHAYEVTGDWQRALDLTEHRLATAKEPDNRVLILKEAADTAEKRSGERSLAYEYISRAFALAPDDEALEEEMFRLAHATDGWRSFADVYRRVVDALESAGGEAPRRPELISRLRTRMGDVLETRLEDPRGALSAYVKAFADAPSDVELARAVVRMAGPNVRWDAAAKTIIQHALATGTLDDSLFALLEQVASSPATWDGITGAFANAVTENVDLAPWLARDLEAKIAAWHRDRRGDPDAAEAAFARALVHDGMNPEILSALAQLQRRAKGRPLVDSLLRLSQATNGDLDLLREAAEIATSAVGDRALAKSILEKLMKLAVERWLPSSEGLPTAGVTSGEAGPPEVYLKWAAGELTRIHNEEGDAERIVDLLVETAKLPFDVETRRAMRHQAARVAVDRLEDRGRSILLYESLVDEDAHDREAVTRLAELYAHEGRTTELLALRKRQIEGNAWANERTALRLGAARLEVTLGHLEDAVKTLGANLKDEPRHVETVSELVSVFAQAGWHTDLAALLAEQGALAETAGDVITAAEFWARAAKVAEERLSDSDAAITYHARVVGLAPDAASYDALARLTAARQDYLASAEYLIQLRACAPADEGPDVTLRLADTLIAAGREDVARQRLEEAVEENPTAEQLRTRLAAIYLAANDFAPLASLLARGAAHAGSRELRLARLRDAADLYRNRCGLPDAAVPLLEQAAELDPEDRTVRLTLADTLGAAGRVEEARTLLRALIDGFGGRRPKERAPVHYHLARLDLVAGDRTHALAELDAATRIDPGNAEILRALAELARDDGQLDRAERSYRALLAVVRRQDNPDENVEVTKSEVLLELSEIARRQGELERADEILESALEAAGEHPIEGARLESALRKREQWATLVKALELRLSREGESPRAADALFELADVLGKRLGRNEEAFTVALRAVQATPASTAVHETMLALAKSTNAVARYVDVLGAMAKTAEVAGNATLAGDVYLRLGVTLEEELGDSKRAAEVFERAETLGKVGGDLLRALERAYLRTGDRAGQERVLARLVESEQSATPRVPARLADALLRLAALRLRGGPDALDEACGLLAQVLDLDPRADVVVGLLREATATYPSHEPLVDLYEQVGRRDAESGRGVLLEALKLRVQQGGERGVAALREAIQLARDLGDGGSEEELLRRYIEVVRQDEGERPHATTSLLRLAEHAEAHGDLREALALRAEAANSAEPDEARRICFAVAADALSKLVDAELAAKLYARLAEQDPGDRAAWAPLLNIYRSMGDAERRGALLATVIETLDNADERVSLRVERAKLLLDRDPVSTDAASELERALDEAPGHVEVATLLLSLLERAGREDELAALLNRQLDAAKDRQDSAMVSTISARLGAMLEKKDPRAAIEVYSAALDWDGKSEAALRALLRLYVDHGDANDRADVMDRLLPLLVGVEAEKVALDLAALREEMWDQDGAERAMMAGFRAHPVSRALRERLTSIYTEKGERAKLAELMALDAQVRVAPEERGRLLRDAAGIFRLELGDPARAAALLREARSALPGDGDLFDDLISALTESGNLQGAATELTTAIARFPEGDVARAPLLAQRASLRAELGDHGGALYDLERAYTLDPNAYVEPLVQQLTRLREEAARAGDVAKEAALVMRLSALLVRSGQADAARLHLGELLARDPKNKDALRSLAEVEESTEQWDAAVYVCQRLVLLEDGHELVETALRLADMCERTGELHFARSGLERALRAEPENAALRDRLRGLYAKTGAWRELAEMSLAEARTAENDETRFASLVKAASLLLANGLDARTALVALDDARKIKPNDIECAALACDAHLALNQRTEAADVVQTTLQLYRGKRSRDLALLYHRLARIERVGGDPRAEMQWLNTALDMDGQNGVVASELAEAGLTYQNWELATKALRAVTMLKTPAPLARAIAYQKLGEIARMQGDPKKAILLLKRAVEDDPSLDEARTLLAELTGH